jgi:hypothetical protein
LLASFLERAQALVQSVLNRFSRCCRVAFQLGPLNHLTLAGDAFLEHTDLPISLRKKVVRVLHRYDPASQSGGRENDSASLFPSPAFCERGHRSFARRLIDRVRRA